LRKVEISVAIKASEYCQGCENKGHGTTEGNSRSDIQNSNDQA
jgi:hypothetical protein